MNRSIDGIARTPTRLAVPARPFTRRGPTFEPGVSKDQPSGSTLGRGSLPGTASRVGKKYHDPSKSWKERLQMPLIILGGMSAGFAIQNAALGQILIVVFGIVSLVYRIPSRISFGLALAALLTTTVLLVLIGNFVLSQTFAVYTFLFLVVGVITLNRELKKEGGRIYSRRPRT